MLGSSEVGATPPTPGKAKKPGSVGCRGVGGVAPTYVSLRPPRNTERRRSGLRPRRLLIFPRQHRSEEHTSELQSLMRISYAVFCLKKKKEDNQNNHQTQTIALHI